MAIVDATHIWLGGTWGTVVRTTNGGGIWERQDKTDVGGVLSTVQTINGVHFRDANNGCITGSGNVHFYTTNGGSLWSRAEFTNLPVEEGILTFDSLFFTSPLEGWVRMTNLLTSVNRLLHTTNGGVTWQVVSVSSPQWPARFAFASSTQGWGILADGSLMQTTSGGGAWSSQSSGTSAKLNQVFFLPASQTGGTPRGWAVGDAGTIVSYGGTQPPGHQCFLDVPPSHTYYTAIEGLSHAGVIDGYDVSGGKEFRPQNNILRAQFAKMILGVLKITVSESDWQDSSKPFTDLELDDPGKLYPNDYVGKAYALQITYGKTATTFAPYVDITRAQVISMVVRAGKNFKQGALETPPTGWNGGGLTSYYSNPYHGENVRVAEFNGLLDGVAGVGPSWSCEAKASRGESAQIMWNLYNLEGNGPPPSEPQLLFSDDFSTGASGWSEGGDGNYQLACDTSLSRYTITISEPNWLAWTWLGASYSDFTVEVDALSLPSLMEGLYGLIFRVSSDGKDMYQFVVSSEGFWQLWRVAGGSRSSLTQVQDNPASAINKGTAWNHLKVTAKGATVNMYVNGTNVCELTGASLASGRLGFIGGTTTSGGLQLGFDNYKIWSTP